MNNTYYKQTSSLLKTFTLLVLSMVLSLSTSYALDLPDEREEETLDKVITEELDRVEKQRAEKGVKGRLSTNLKVSYGYETNPQLTAGRKDDHFETVRYTLNYRKTFLKNNQFTLLADVNAVRYNEITDLNNNLGHINLGYKMALNKNYIFGLGYDFSFTHFPLNDQTTFFYPKLTANIQHRPSKSFYHQLQYEIGWKIYNEALALLHSSTTFQDNERRDIREGVEYKLGYTMTNRLSSTISLKGYFNNSNAFFNDFHDYHSYKINPRLSYKITNQLLTNMSYSYEHKDYTSREVGTGNYEQIDRISNGKVGFNYKHNDQHSFTLDYTYRENASNDLTSDYTGSTIEGGWRYIF